MASKRGPQFWKHRVVARMWNEEKQVEELIMMHFPTSDEAGMMVYLLVHTLDQRNFSAVQETRRADGKYYRITQGDWSNVSFSPDKFAELQSKRQEKGDMRTNVQIRRLNDMENTFKFRMYFRSVEEGDIAVTLLNTGLRHLKIMITNERRIAQTSEWEPFRTASFVPDELALLWSKFSKENQKTALKSLTDLFETSQG